jgi:hypothetical protein
MRNQVRVGVMMRIRTAAISAAFAVVSMLPGAVAQAQTAPSGVRLAQAQPAATETPAQRRRHLKRLPIYPRSQEEPDDVYPRYDPGPNAVRDCTATYVQEYRPSGTVIVPRMSCYWRRG